MPVHFQFTVWATKKGVTYVPRTLAEGVPEAFDKLLIRGLHPRRELRHQSADQILAELKDMMRIV